MNLPASSDAHPWCVVAASHDLAPGSLLPIVLHGQHVALWRAQGGAAHAWTDRCPHRGMRLSLGAVAPRGLICPYHGWRFGEDRQCNFIPAHPQTPPPRAAAPQAHALQERPGWLWVRLQPAAGETREPPAMPELPDTLAPVRSLLVQAEPAQIARAFGASCSTPARPDAALALRGHWSVGTQADAEVVLMLQPAAPGQHMLHLASMTALALPQRQALNRRLVALRDTLYGALPLEATR